MPMVPPGCCERSPDLAAGGVGFALLFLSAGSLCLLDFGGGLFAKLLKILQRHICVSETKSLPLGPSPTDARASCGPWKFVAVGAEVPGGDTHSVPGAAAAPQLLPPPTLPCCLPCGQQREAGEVGGYVLTHSKPSGAVMSEAQLTASKASSDCGRSDHGEDGSFLQSPLPGMLLGVAGARK